ncbi:phospholipid/glycerol acyltransferase [Calothrix sp. NIES-4101]|nr:phospholipid/glycerol acyltransferase [Calothrix sp. NIES-4101]
MKKLLRLLFFLIVIRIVVLIIIGLRIVNKERLPKSGPAIIVANHNSHLDTMVLMTIFPIKLLDKLRPVAAEDYFLRNPFLAWFSLNVLNIISLKRQNLSVRENPLINCSEALANGDILIIYPEGSRGKPESLSTFKSGIAHLAKSHPDVPIYPIFMYGLGKVLPKGEALLVPFICDIFIGEKIYWTGSKQKFMDLLNQSIKDLASEINFLPGNK